MIKVNLDRNWSYIESDLIFHPGFLAQLEWKPVDLPHDRAIEKEREAKNPSGAQEGYTAGCNLYYKKELELKEEWRGKNFILEFEGVMGITEVFVNDRLVVKHVNGYTSFLVDITNYVSFGNKNTILVHVKNSHKPSSRWYAGSGIYRHVWLNIGGNIYIKPWNLHVKTISIDNDTATLEVKTCIVNTMDKDIQGKILFEIISQEQEFLLNCEEQLLLNAKEEKVIVKKIKLSPFRYWDIEDPYLYTIKATIINNDEIEDASSSTFGIRTISVDSTEGFKLNGRPLKLKGGCIHHDHGPLGTASYDRAEERKVELLKASGFNAVRLAHNPYSPAFLDACDRLGMLVIEEFFDVWSFGKVSYDYHIFFEKHWEEDLESTIIRDFNHPSIVIWSIGNEVNFGAGIEIENKESVFNLMNWCQKLSNKVRELDSTRFVTASIPSFPFELNFRERNIIQDGNFMVVKMESPIDPSNDKWGEITEEFFKYLDIAGYNYKVDRYEFDKNKYPDRVICGTETHPYTLYDNWKETIKNSNVIGDFVWTAIDYLGEAGIGKVSIGMEGVRNYLGEFPWFIANCGDIDICGEKRPQSYYRDIIWGLRKDPFLAVLPPDLYDKTLVALPWSFEPVERNWTFPGFEGKKVKVYVYADADEVELFLNGKSYGKKECNKNTKYKTWFDLNYEPGILEVVSYKDGKEVGRDVLKTSGPAVSLKAYPDREIISASYGDLCYIKIVALDKDGNLVPNAENRIEVQIEGPGKLVALGTADPLSTELFINPRRKLYKGKALAVVKSLGESGDISVKINGENIDSTKVIIKCK